MTQFRIVGSRKAHEPDIADFDVIYLRGTLNPGNEFIVYDTHHPIKCTVLESTSKDNKTTLRCRMYLGLGWENQFADAIVDTEAKKRPEAFGYDHTNKS